MKTIVLALEASIEAVLGDVAYELPPDYKVPYTVLVRYAYVDYRKDFLAGAKFKIAGYGVLTTSGRHYTLETEEKYRAAKGYPEKIEGVW